jgi:hypothetical protein
VPLLLGYYRRMSFLMPHFEEVWISSLFNIAHLTLKSNCSHSETGIAGQRFAKDECL